VECSASQPFGGSAAPEKDQPLDLGIVDVIGVTPLQGSTVAAQKIPANIQTVSSEHWKNPKPLISGIHNPLSGQREH